MNADLVTACRELGLAAHTFPWGSHAEEAGFSEDAAYLVRPDGYVAAALAEQSVRDLRAFMVRFGIRLADKKALQK